jgi:hypothetical protein
MSSLPLPPDSGPRLVGIARLAAHGESVRQGHEVEYFTLPVRIAAEPVQRVADAVYLDDQSLSVRSVPGFPSRKSGVGRSSIPSYSHRERAVDSIESRS